MKKIFYFLLLFFILKIDVLAIDAWILSGWWKVDWEKIRKWNITIEDIPAIISWAAEFLIVFAWTIAVIFLIVWAYKYLFWSLEWNAEKWKDTIFMALVWFAIASCAYIIIKFIFDNFAK